MSIIYSGWKQIVKHVFGEYMSDPEYRAMDMVKEGIPVWYLKETKDTPHIEKEALHKWMLERALSKRP